MGRSKGRVFMAKIDAKPQAQVVAFLLSHRPYKGAGPVRHIETHGAHIFLCGKEAFKIKRSTRYVYMDLSTPDLRRALLLRELALNRVTAPMIYRDVVPITRTPDGGLTLNGAGPPVEWVLRMHRFPATSEMTFIAGAGQLTDAVAADLGQVIARFHAGCPVSFEAGDALMADILDELAHELRGFAAPLGTKLVESFLTRSRHALTTLAPHLRERSKHGHVRRAHGDLHLRNLLLYLGKPVLFDALEFDERLGTCDVLYDLAFLLMDLCHRGHARAANAVLNAYLLAARGGQDSGLSALPLFLSVRGAIRAMVLMQTDQASGQTHSNLAEARLYLTQAGEGLEVQPPTLTLIGGLSGTGKTVLAQELALRLAPCPGAIHLRTDTERKAGDGRAAVSYTPAARRAIYGHMINRAAAVLMAGHSVILDATFLDETARRAAQDLALRLHIPFRGLWLTAPDAVLLARVSARQNDASDADGVVVRRQLALKPVAPSGWAIIDAGGSALATCDNACAVLDNAVVAS